MYRMLAAVNWRSNCKDGGRWPCISCESIWIVTSSLGSLPSSMRWRAMHGALAALHALGAVYNYRRKNWGDVAAHIAAALYDAHSAHHHYRTEQIALRRLSPAS